MHLDLRYLLSFITDRVATDGPVVNTVCNIVLLLSIYVIQLHTLVSHAPIRQRRQD